MKKVFSFVIVLAAVAMVSCGGNATQPAEGEVEAVAVEEVTPVDSTACAAQCDSTAAAACPKAEGECCNK